MVRWVIVGGAVIILLVRLWTFSHAQSPYRVGQRVQITAMVRTEPIKVYRKQYLVVEGIALEIPVGEQLQYGDKVKVTGTIAPLVTAVKGAKFGLIHQDFHLISSSLTFTGLMQQQKSKLVGQLLRWLPGDEGGLAAGILLGGNQEMSPSLKLAFQRTGLTHVVAASGYNVTIVAGWTMLLFKRLLHRRLAILFGILSIILYVFLSGTTPSVVRAGIMASTLFLGQIWGREADSLWLLVLAGWMMLVINPGYLSDIGWQLSMAATAGILAWRPTGDAWTSLAAQATTLPLILHHFGNLSVIAPVANLLLLWVVPPIMQITAVGLIVGPVNWLAWPLLRLMTGGVTLLGNLPWASFAVGNLSWGWVLGYYAALIMVTYLINLKKAR